MPRRKNVLTDQYDEEDETSDNEGLDLYDAASIGAPSEIEFSSDVEEEQSDAEQSDDNDSSEDWFPGMSPKKKRKAPLPPKHLPPAKKAKVQKKLQFDKGTESQGNAAKTGKNVLFVCELCNKVMASKQSLTQHITNKVCWTKTPSSATPYGRALWCRGPSDPAEAKRPGLEKVKCNHCDTIMTQEKLVTHIRSGVCWRTWDGANPDSFAPKYRPKEKAGPLKDFKNSSPGQIYLELLDAEGDSILEQWIEQTNKQAEFLKQRLKYFKYWKPLTKARAIRWMGIHHLMSLRNPRRRKEFWLRSEFYQCKYAVKQMSYRDFNRILRATHFVDNKVEEGPNGSGNRNSENWTPLWKIQSIFHKLIRAAQRLFRPGVAIAIDESMVKFKGRWKFIQVMPKKPIRKGPKIFGFADAETGYLLNFEIYCKQTFPRQNEMGYLSALVYTLLEGDGLVGGLNYLRKGHKLYIDSFYTMIKLAEDLKIDQTYVVGSIKSDRHIPDCAVRAYHPVTGEKLERGEHFFLHTNSKVMLCVWVDNSIVHLISMIPDVTEEVDNIGRTLKGKDWCKSMPEISLPYPRIVGDFNGGMDGLDLFNQLLAYNRLTYLRSKRWYIPLWIQVLESAFVNSYCIAKWYLSDKEKTELSTREFKENLVRDLFKIADELEGKQIVGEDSFLPPVQHFLDEEGLKTAPKVKLIGRAHVKDQKTVDLRLQFKRKWTPRQMIRKKLFRQHYSVPSGGWHQCSGCVYETRTQNMCSVCLYPLHTWPCHVRFHEMHDYRNFKQILVKKGKNKGQSKKIVQTSELLL